MPSEPCSICSTEPCQCWTCTSCDVQYDSEDRTACTGCDNCSDCCSCWACDGCGNLREESASRCSNCEMCERCCECQWCRRCEESVSSDSYCSECERCDECCDCWTCQSCDTRYTAGSDTTQCSYCDQCPDCCECWYCSGCDESHGDNVTQCVECSRCTDTCNCPRCSGCNDVDSDLCSGCERCDSCECDCDEGDSDAARCTVCNRTEARCYCSQCHRFGADGLIVESHKYNPRSRRPQDKPCIICRTCKEHCQAAPCAGCSNPNHELCLSCGKCGACCSCVWCGNRHYTQNYTRHTITAETAQQCSNCRRCFDHCMCPKCETCSTKVIALCRWCNQCMSCCQGAESECQKWDNNCAIEPRKRPLKKFTPYLPTRVPNLKLLRRLPNPRLIGVELEINNMSNKGRSRKLDLALTKWYDCVVSDGSIGQQPEAFEINAQPSGGDLFLDHMQDLCDGLARMEAAPDKRCGLHVHIDATDLAVFDLSRVIQIYGKVERALFDLCDPSRVGNNYSEPCAEFYKSDWKPKEFRSGLISRLYLNDQPLKVENANEALRKYWGASALDNLTPKQKKERISTVKRLQADKANGQKAEKYGAHRYKALNLHSYFLRKTIEFRHHEGTVDYADIVGWAQVCQHIVTLANRISPRTVEMLSDQPREALLELMPAKLHPYMNTCFAATDAALKAHSGLRLARQNYWPS